MNSVSKFSECIYTTSLWFIHILYFESFFLFVFWQLWLYRDTACMIHFLTKRSKRLFHEIYIMISLLCMSWEIFSHALIVGMFCGGLRLLFWVLDVMYSFSSFGYWMQWMASLLPLGAGYSELTLLLVSVCNIQLFFIIIWFNIVLW